MSFVVDATSEEATANLAAALARALPTRMVVALNGTLGAGKTRLVQELAAAMGYPRAEVQSPTFTLVHEYRGPGTLFHFDAYRVRDEDEFEALGAGEYFEADGVSLVEWADRVAASLPRDRLEIQIEVTGASSRRFLLRAGGPESAAVLSRVGSELEP